MERYVPRLGNSRPWQRSRPNRSASVRKSRWPWQLSSGHRPPRKRLWNPSELGRFAAAVFSVAAGHPPSLNASLKGYLLSLRRQTRLPPRYPADVSVHRTHIPTERGQRLRLGLPALVQRGVGKTTGPKINASSSRSIPKMARQEQEQSIGPEDVIASAFFLWRASAPRELARGQDST